MLKEMPKNEGVRLAGRDGFGGTKIEPPKDNPPTYFELGIDKKDASRCQQMAENKKEIVEKIEELEKSGKLVKESTIINQVRKEKQRILQFRFRTARKRRGRGW